MRVRRSFALGTALVCLTIAPTAGTAQEASDLDLEVYGEADFDWMVRPLDGEEFSLDVYRGEVLFINLWATWCLPCIREMGSIERLRERLADTDVRFMIVAADDEPAIRRYLRRYSYDLPIYIEEDRIPDAFGLQGLPSTWLVDRDGRIVLVRHGEAVWDTDEVETFIRAVASGS